MVFSSSFIARGAGFASACVCCLFTLILALPPAHAASRGELKAALKEILREEPDLILDVLRENSEVVLEVAQQGNMQRRRKTALAQWQIDAKQPKKVNYDTPAVRGPASAPVTIVAYSDFTCPYCRQADAVLEQLYEKYKGKVRLVFKALPKDDHAVSLAAARFSIAAFLQDKEKGWALYHALFAGAADIERDGDTFLKAAAVKAGLDLKKLLPEAGGAKVKAILEEDRKEADALEVPGTPYFLINNLVVRGAVPKELFEEAIETALKLKQQQ